MTQAMPYRVAVACATVLALSALPLAQSRLTVGVAGIRVAGPGIGANGTEKRPFNWSTGTTVSLMVKAPQGAGIVDLDDDESVLDAATDDKGTDLREDVDFKSFPEIAADGSAGLIEVEIGRRPTKGATTITLEGKLAVTTAAGSKPSKSAPVTLATAKGFKVGTIAVAISEMSASDEGVDLTLKMPAAAHRSIKALRFQDAKGADIEADRRGSMTSSNEAELYYRINGSPKTVIVVADVWQGLKVESVPFKVTAGIGLE